MIVTVTPNPAVDVTIATPHLDLGASHAVPASWRRAGGKGLNVARVLAQTGHPVIATGPVGAADAAWFAEDLPGVDTRLTACDGATRSTFALVEQDAGRTTQLNERGTARSANDWDAVVAATAHACVGAACLTVSGSLPPHAPESLVRRLLHAGRDAGIPVIADVSGRALRDAAAFGADAVKPNRDELAATVGIADPIAGARALQRAGARLVLVSLGEDGCVAVPRHGDPLHARLPRVLHGNATGAGDAVVAAVAAAVDDGLRLDRDLAAVLRRAVAWSAAAVLAPLAGALDPRHDDLAGEVIVEPARPA